MNIKAYRKFTSISAAIVVVLLCVTLWGCSDNDNTDNPQITEMVKTKFTAYKNSIAQSAGGLALYIITPDGEYFASSDMPDASPDIHFRVASNTKTFTSSAIMMLYEKGLIDIDDTITSNIPGRNEPYIPDTPEFAIPYKNQITIRQLLSHRAGVFDVSNNFIPASCNEPYSNNSYIYYIMEVLGDHYHQFSFSEMVSVAAKCHLSSFQPGTDYHYSNTGYSLLGEIIERVSGEVYADFIYNNLISPNKLSETSVPYLATDNAIPDPHPVGYYISDGGLMDITDDNMSANVAEGNIISTPANLARWIRRLMHGDAGVSSDMVNLMTQCASDIEYGCYGLGIT